MNKKWLIDVSERTVSAFIITFVGILAIADPTNLLNVSAAKSAAAAGIIAGLTVLKGALAAQFGDPNSAAALPAKTLAEAPGAAAPLAAVSAVGRSAPTAAPVKKAAAPRKSTPPKTTK